MNTYLLVILLCQPGASIPCRPSDALLVEVEGITTKRECEAKAQEFKQRNPAYIAHLCSKERQLRTNI